MIAAPTAAPAALDLSQIVARLDRVQRELQGDFPLTWYHLENPPAEPCAASLEGLVVWDRPYPTMLHKGGKDWFAGTVIFPESKCGIALDGSEGRIFISGYSPFTLWVDGTEIFRETHVWHASGPIGDPITTAIEPGRPYRLTLCLEPTELPAGWEDFGIAPRLTACTDMSVEIGAAALQLRIAEKLAKLKAERKLVLDAARTIDLPALEETRWDAVCASIAAMEETLAPLSARAKALTVHLIGHTHIDMDWMWTWPDTVHCVRRDAKAVTDMMADYPELTFTHSQVPTYQILQQMEPEVFAKDSAVHRRRAVGECRRHLGGRRPEHGRRRIVRPPRALCGGVDAGQPRVNRARALGAGYLWTPRQYAAVGQTRRVR